MDSFSGKRQRDPEPRDRNGRYWKRPNQSGGDQEQVLPTPDDTTYRILCPVVKVGGIIGKGGNVIKSMRRETFTRIKVLDPVPGVDERVVLIWSTPQDEERAKQKDGNRDSKSRDGRDKSGGKKYAMPDDGSFVCPAQEALFKVHAKILEEEGNVTDNDAENASEVTARLLVPNNQIGCLLGKGGKIAERMRNETGAQIRISQKDNLPGCALPSDELVQISGDPIVVKKAMYEVSARIYESPLKDRPQGTATFLPSSMVPSGGRPDAKAFPPINSMYAGGSHHAGPPPLSGYESNDIGSTWPLTNSAPPLYSPPGAPHTERTGREVEQEFSIHLLCPIDRIGIVIGKGGNAIRLLRDKTGARIKVDDAVKDAQERLIVISAAEHIDDRSPVIEAALELQGKAGDIDGDKEGLVTTRLLVPAKLVGCLLGEGGSVISQMRKKTNADIKVSRKKDLPKCARDTDELVQIVGDEDAAREALLEILMRLRNKVFRDQIDVHAKSGGRPLPSLNDPPMQGGFAAPPPSLGSRQELGSPRSMYSLSRLGLQGGQLASNYGSLAPLQGAGSGYEGYSFPDSNVYNGPLPGGVGGLSNGSLRHSSGKIIEVTIPRSSVSSVLGKGGSNIGSIRQISGAELKVHEAHSSSGDLIIEIAGTTEQTRAAHSLLQALTYSGQSSAGDGPWGYY